jgi:hypothetical protein
VPREYADELRDADPEPCPVCDALPHRQAMASGIATAPMQRVNAQLVEMPDWLSRLLGLVKSGAKSATPVTAPATSGC